MDLISIANDLHSWLREQDEQENLTKKVRIITENLDAVIYEHKLYKINENPTENNN